MDSEYIKKETTDPEYIKKFWVGLMDGDGSIQVNHWRGQSLQYRLVIKLKHTIENMSMLLLINKHIGGLGKNKGKVRIVNKNEFVIWVVDSKKSILEIIKIFKLYPPITSRLQAQLKYLIECIQRNDVKWYLETRNSKYLPINSNTSPFDNLIAVKMTHRYFNEWLSGFIEAEGCFSIRQNNNVYSFSIGQNDDKYLIEAIKSYFRIQNQIRNPKKTFFFIETYRRSTLQNIISHCNKYPLLGQKLVSFNKFKNLIN
jgi:hypothetical protein